MLILVLVFLATLSSGSASISNPMCTYGKIWWPMRGQSNDFYLARATGDSVFVRDLYWNGKGLFSTRQSGHDQKISVFGQIAEVMQPGYDASSRTAVGEKLVLVWWSYGPSCEIVPTRRALVAAPGAQLFVNLSPLPRPSWVNQLKTYDVEGQFQGTSRLYAPEFVPALSPGQDGSAERMTAAEFMEMYRMLTPEGAPTEAGLQQFLVWAGDNRQLARKYPACAMLHDAEANLVARAHRPVSTPCR